MKEETQVTAMKILSLTLNKKYFDMIASGEKKEEYREIKGFWSKRFSSNPRKLYIIGIGWTNYTIHKDADDYCMFLKNGVSPDMHYMKKFIENISTEAIWNPFDIVSATNGYSKGCPNVKWKHEGIAIGYGREEWGAEPGKNYFILKIGDLIK